MAFAQTRWDCPAALPSHASPIALTPDTVARGRQLVRQSCAECHGETGLGDGPAGVQMNPRPTSWRSPAFQAQSDACIFWKLSVGRDSMPPAGRMPEHDRWQIVHFIRSLDAN